MATGESTTDTLKKNIDTLKAQLDAATEKLKVQDADDSKVVFKENVKARVALEGKARRVMKDKATDIENLDDVELMRTVIKHSTPKLDLAGKSDDYIKARFDCVMEDFRDTTGTGNGGTGKKSAELDLGKGMTDGSGNEDAWDQVYENSREAQWKRDREAWKPKQKQA
jgi:hypothetical protein